MSSYKRKAIEKKPYSSFASLYGLDDVFERQLNLQNVVYTMLIVIKGSYKMKNVTTNGNFNNICGKKFIYLEI